MPTFSLALAFVLPVTAAPVVGGGPAPEGAWPDLAALFTANHSLACSGVLIAPDLVLTAGHCGFGIEGVELGGGEVGQGERIRVIETLVHPDYFTTLDAAILVLDHPASVPPRMLARDCIVEDWLTNGAEVIIAGYGATDLWATEWTEVPYQAETTIVDATCADTATGCNEDVSPGGELIAGGGGIDSCTGDSGGPLYLEVEEPGEEGSSPSDFLVGITSRATIPAPTPCGEGGIYVRTDALADWIEAETGETLPRPECEGRNRVPMATASPILATRGLTAATLIVVNDPDTDQHHSLSLVEPPAHGLAQLDPEGALYYLAPNDFVGTDNALIEVTDDGEPPRSFELEVPITVTAGSAVPSKGCETGPGRAGLPGAAWLLVLLGSRYRRGR